MVWKKGRPKLKMTLKYTKSSFYNHHLIHYHIYNQQINKSTNQQILHRLQLNIRNLCQVLCIEKGTSKKQPGGNDKRNGQQIKCGLNICGI